MAQDICYHSKREEREYKVLDQSKPENQLDKLQTLHLLLMSKYFSDLKLLWALLTAAHFSSWAGSTPCEQSLTGVPWFWHLQHVGVSKAIQPSPSQLHAMSSVGLHGGPHGPVAFLSCRGRFHTSYVLNSKARRTTWSKLPDSVAC